MASKLVLFEKQDVLGFMTDFYRDDDGNLYMTGEQIGRCLGYTNPRVSINNIYSRYKEHLKKYTCDIKLISQGDTQKRTIRFFNERGIYLIAMKSDQPKAWDFQDTHGVVSNTGMISDVILEQLRAGIAKVVKF